jgi:AcrR family transcriptional regulator
MRCPTEPLTTIRCNQILDAAELLIESQGIVSFKYSQLVKEVGCSTGTLYKFFEGKEDILVCLFLRSATSNQLPLFVEQHSNLTAQQKALLPILFTFETIQRSRSFATLRSVSVNTMVWKLASPEKVEKFKRRINAFWYWFTESFNEAVKNGELEATPLQVKELVQGVIFYLTGSLTQFESQIILPKYLSNRRETCYRHLSRLMAQYKWKVPLNQEIYDDLEQKTQVYFAKNYRSKMTCEACHSLAKNLMM